MFWRHPRRLYRVRVRAPVFSAVLYNIVRSGGTHAARGPPARARPRRQTVSCWPPDQLIRIVNKAPARARTVPAFHRSARPSARKPVPSTSSDGGGDPRRPSGSLSLRRPDQSLVNREPPSLVVHPLVHRTRALSTHIFKTLFRVRPERAQPSDR